MTTVDFYILATHTGDAFFHLVCRVVEKAYKQKHRIYIHTANQATAHQLDEFLWTYRDDSFLPHHLYGEGPHPEPPIQIGYDITPDKAHDVLINLTPDVPTFYKQFKRILEFVSSEPDAQAAGRERYRFYRTHQLTIKTHKL